jgi:peroxiredoxin|tara:strand:+ start:407 stop:904 length:498 start_codon:yes stop_codon:yes gene_type:complete
MLKLIQVSVVSFICAFASQFAYSASVGDEAPSFRARSLDGSETISNTDLVGKVVFVDFWASWCPPCLKSLPEFENLQTSFSGRDDVVVIAINLDDNPQDAKDFINKINVSYKILADNSGEIPQAFGVNAMPTSYIIDKSGVIRYVHSGYKTGDVNKIKNEIEKLL